MIKNFMRSRNQDQIIKPGKDTSSVPQGCEIVPKCRASERHEIIFADAKNGVVEI